MPYDPFSRGPLPVGVRTQTSTDATRERTLPFEIWYPASDAHAGQDLDEASKDSYQVLPIAPATTQDAVRDAEARSGRFPLVMFSHGFGGHRRQTTHFCTHLASHGYVVASPDHVGNTMPDMMQLATAAAGGSAPPDPLGLFRTYAEHRPADVSFGIDRLLAGEAGVPADSLDASRVGMTGHSFGGWTTLAVTGHDERIGAALPLAPAGGRTPLVEGENPLRESLDLDWGRPVPTLYLVAEFDTLLPLEGMQDLYDRTISPKQMVVLRNADHMHFCDDVEQTHEMFRTIGGMLTSGLGPRVEGIPDFSSILDKLKPASELCPGEDAYTYLRGLGLAHLDAHLRANEDAAKLLAGDIEALLAKLGVSVSVV